MFEAPKRPPRSRVIRACWLIVYAIGHFVSGGLLFWLPWISNDKSANGPSRRYPMNAAGDFYVLDQCCITCGAPEHEAPDLMSHEEGPGAYAHCYFKRQPETAAEEEQAVMAVVVGCCGAVRYGGRDPRIIARLRGLGKRDACDAQQPDIRQA
ncbi:MAG TPA: hypothetical protein VGN12_17385 [Pirellulales bacterium]|jgi:hypothetical protein